MSPWRRGLLACLFAGLEAFRRAINGFIAQLLVEVDENTHLCTGSPKLPSAFHLSTMTPHAWPISAQAGLLTVSAGNLG